MRTVLRSIAAAIAGYAVIVVVTSVAFPLILGHPLVQKDDPREVLLGTLIAVAAGLAGGWVATLAGVLRPVVNAALVTIPIAIETTLVLWLRTPRDEIVHSAAGAVILMGSTVAAGVLRELFARRHRPAAGAV
ncbi:MAG TPA: hypothetical protein VM779_09010 [Thermoanaerobaculia bacterium]|nr:hypothetical protein [Thermoanaerobaculia bacterium]